MADKRPIRLTTPLEDGVLLPYRVVAQEELGRPFRVDVDLLSEDAEVKFEELLGKPMSIEASFGDGETRYFHGIVSQFFQTGSLGRYVTYSATLRPWLWFLTRATDSRVYGSGTEDTAKNVPELVKDVFRNRGMNDFDENLKSAYLPRSYCVQYEESDFDFVSRLLESEGIYYFFRHEKSKHTLVLCDDPGSHDPVLGYDEIPFGSDASEAQQEQIDSWTLTKKVRSGRLESRSFDFVSPQSELTVEHQVDRAHDFGDFPVYIADGKYVQSYDVARDDGSDRDALDRGRTIARVRLEEFQSRYETVTGSSNAIGLCVGGTFRLRDHLRPDQNREYLIVNALHELRMSEYEGIGDALGGNLYSCAFGAIPSKEPFRPRRRTRRPKILGPQTATVAGKAGEEIWTDKHGRIKVQFHWDRYGQKDENSSCWVRVAQVWAGGSWGGQYIPRIGQEVIVEFIEGDPDRPLVTGGLYNGRQPTPYTLPDNATQSGVKSRSSKGGAAANFNELRFEDKKGGELVYFHAEKDKSVVVENDNAEAIGHDEKIDVKNNRDKTVGIDQSETIGSNKSISVGKNHTEKIGVNMGLTVGADATETIGANRTISIGADKTESISANHTQTVGINSAEMIGAAKETVVGAAYVLTVGGAATILVGASMDTKVAGSSEETIGGEKKLTVSGPIAITTDADHMQKSKANTVVDAGDGIAAKAGKKILIEAGDSIIIQTGSAAITLKKDGTINIQGKDISLDASGKLNLKASSDVTVKGSKVKQN